MVVVKKILRDFKQFRLLPYKNFAENVVSKMLDKPEYADESGQVGKVSAAYDEFKQAYELAIKGGAQAKAIRDEKRVILTNELEILAKLLESKQENELSWFIGTGFELRRKPENYKGALERAIIEALFRGVASGTVEGITQAFPISVTQIAIEYSPDNQVTWHNGTYSTGRKFLLKDLPLYQKVWVRVCFMGTRQRMGDWSEPREIFIL